MELPEDLKQQGIKAIFHALLLKLHIPYEDRRFPGRNYKQIVSLEADDNEWAVEKIASHRGKGSNAMFEIVWQTGDCTWETYRVVRHLEALKQYFEALGIKHAKDLLWKEDDNIPYDELSNSGSETLEAYNTNMTEPAWKLFEQGIRNTHNKATEEVLPACHATMSTTHILGDIMLSIV
ncbi:hypothetical protein BN14_06989 [Rhizoctonia solani AG-1 IB]|uniref:Chromo domain-containing protein n=1 Tax=Thanatephorus cucumeris (strain AG1-IB / isolate 7/3/14) TaxID=1108050 RepID=M5C1R4_THACB|nr:hypothetical protein BN14_06989 [Rhizoctonia solani AG-1 IB]